MFVKERLDLIVQKLTEEERVFVKELSEIFQVSQDAIRKDLKVLENQGILERTYGGGILKKSIPPFVKLTERNKINTETKQKIADKAFNLVKRGETIFLDISSTNILLAEKIAKSNLELTVISNSIDILYILNTNSHIQIITPGGILCQKIDGFVGSATIEAISKYKVQKTFIGSCGVDLDKQSINTFNIEDGNTKKAMMNSGKEVILVMENKKFFYEGIYQFANIADVDTIITEDEPAKGIKNKLKKYKIRLI